MNIIIILIPSILLIIYLAFLNEESKLLKIIYRKLSKMNPDARKRTLTLSSSKSYITNEIIRLLEDVTDNISIHRQYKNVKQSYQRMEKLAGLYANKEGASLSSVTLSMSSSTKIGQLRNVNRLLDMVALRNIR
jgi:hypothetical protein